MAVEPRNERFNHERPPLGTAIFHPALDRMPARDWIIAIDYFAGNAERLAAVDDMVFGVNHFRRRRYSPMIVGDDDQYRQLVSRPSGPDHAGREIAFGRARIPAA